MPAKGHSQPEFEWPRISAFRLKRHHFMDERFADLSTVSRDVCGIQAQVMAAAEMALWARVQNLTRAEIHSALWKSRTLVKTSGMRGTLHLLSASDFPVYIGALRRMRVREMLRITARYGVTEKEAYGVMGAAVEALAGGPMRRRELSTRVLSLGIVSEKARPWFEQAAWGVVRQAIVEGLVCYGPPRGQEVTFVRVDQWLPEQREVPELAAQQLLLRRYLAAYGPAVPQDFRKWTGFSMPEVSAIWESLEAELAEVRAEGRKGFILSKDYATLADSHLPGPVLRLLPGFDPYMLGHANKDGLVAANHYKRVYHQVWWISPVVLLDGRVIATWSYDRQPRRVVLRIAPFKNLSKNIRAGIEEAAASLGAFLETPWEIEFSKPN